MYLQGKERTLKNLSKKNKKTCEKVLTIPNIYGILNIINEREVTHMLYLEKWTERTIDGECYTLYRETSKGVRVVRHKVLGYQVPELLAHGVKIR